MNIYWNIENQQLVRGLNGGGKVTIYTCVLRDNFPVTIYLCTEQSNILTPYAVTAITVGHAIKFAARQTLNAATYLVEQPTWTPAGSGVTQRYEAVLPLDGALLIAAMAGLSSLDLFAELTTQDVTGKQYLSTQFTLRVIPDVITGGES